MQRLSPKGKKIYHMKVEFSKSFGGLGVQIKGGSALHTLAFRMSVPLGSKAVHVCRSSGSDEIGEGTSKKPFLTPLKAIKSLSGDPEGTYLIRDFQGEGYKPFPKTTLKKNMKFYSIQLKKPKPEVGIVDEDEGLPDKDALEKAKSIKLINSAPADEVPVFLAHNHVDKRVFVQGWVNRIRKHPNIAFVILRDGRGYLQCAFSGEMCATYDFLMLGLEASIKVYGIIKKVPEGKNSPNNIELLVDYWEVIGKSPVGAESFSNKLNIEAKSEVLYDLRHLVIRGNNASSVLKFRAKTLKYFRQYFDENQVVEVTPPTLVTTQVEGGATLFGLKYYDKDAYLTQSSQFYLEAACPSVGDCYCIVQSYRAEVSHTRRHLSEYTHVEAELNFITFEKLLDFIENMVVYVAEKLFNDPDSKRIIESKFPSFNCPQKPFMRITYEDAIKWLNKAGIKKQIETNDEIKEEDYTFGDDIPEMAERKMIDTLNRPVFLINFPASLKSFYMSRVKNDQNITESCDLLLPNVGEIVGGSMRITDYDEILAAYKREGICPDPYYWYNDQRKYGPVPHGGFGLGLERFIAWILKLHTVREACLFPRYTGRCEP